MRGLESGWAVRRAVGATTGLWADRGWCGTVDGYWLYLYHHSVERLYANLVGLAYMMASFVAESGGRASMQWRFS